MTTFRSKFEQFNFAGKVQFEKNLATVEDPTIEAQLRAHPEFGTTFWVDEPAPAPTTTTTTTTTTNNNPTETDEQRAAREAAEAEAKAKAKADGDKKPKKT